MYRSCPSHRVRNSVLISDCVRRHMRDSREVHLSPGCVTRSGPHSGRLQFVPVVAVCYGGALRQALRVGGFLPCAHPGARSDISRLKKEPSEYVSFNGNWKKRNIVLHNVLNLKQSKVTTKYFFVS
jgi:hypothetical protein